MMTSEGFWSLCLTQAMPAPGLLQYPREFTCTQFLLKVWLTVCYPCWRCFEGCSVARCSCWTQRPNDQPFPRWPAWPHSPRDSQCGPRGEDEPQHYIGDSTKGLRKGHLTQPLSPQPHSLLHHLPFSPSYVMSKKMLFGPGKAFSLTSPCP